MEPLSAGAIFAGINSAFRFAEYAVRIAEVGTENEVFVRTIQVVRNDLDEVQRLLSLESVRKRLTSNPAKMAWIKAAVHSTRTALYEIGRWVERARVDQQATGSIKFETRVRWVFNDHEKLHNRQTELSACHRQLSSVLAFLTPLEEILPTANPPSFDQVIYFDDIIPPWQRRKQLPQVTSVKPYDLAREGTYRPQASEPSNQKDYSGYPSATSLSGCHSFTTPNNPNPPTSCSSAVPANPTANTPAHFESSYPSSPPPPYASVTPVSAPTEGFHQKYGTSGDLQRGSQVHMAKTTLPSIQATTSTAYDAKPPEIYAYRDPQYGNYPGSLQKDHWCMSGTNHSGPVDPLGLYAERPGGPIPRMQATSLTKSTNISEVSELFGDLSFPTELPSNDPGPPLGYPQPKAKPSRSPSSAFHPVASTSDYDRNGGLHELPSVDAPIQRTPRLGSHELPGLIPNASWASLSTPSQRNTIPLEARSAPDPQADPVHRKTVSSTRMRNQKGYMDMLGSIEPS